MTVDLDLSRLEQWLAPRVPGYRAPLTARKFPHGQSNPTYRLSTGDRHYVLRRKPFGELLPSAHAVDREYRVLSALHPLGFPVPRPIGLCEDLSVIGAMFYVMELVEGRTFWKGTLPDQRVQDRRAIYEDMILTLGRLHCVDFAAAGLSDFGRPGNYFERQVARWTRQYRASQTEDIPEVERLIEWLPGTVPEQTRTSIIHGDYRIDNLIFAPQLNRVAAVIDWELATIGDPLADFAYLMMNWVMPIDDRAGLLGTDFARTGIPSMEEAVSIYCQATGRNGVPDLHWYFAFNLFRLTAIVQGIKRRMLDGNASSANASETVAQLLPLARAAWEQAGLSACG
jgi:aminoglycoside phosphotransferase (APT) family kinase protein